MQMHHQKKIGNSQTVNRKIWRFRLTHVLCVVVLLVLSAFSLRPIITRAQTPVSVSTPFPLSLQAAEQIFRVNIPAVFQELVTLAVLTVEGESIFQDVLVNGEFTVSNESIFDGEITLNGTVTGNNINISVGSGTITASNLVYSVAAGDGISVSGGQNVTVTNSDRGSSQNIFKNFTVGGTTISAGSNSDTITLAAGDGIALSTSGKTITFTNLLSGTWVESGNYVVLDDINELVGIGTETPSNSLEINSMTTDESGLTFTQLTSASPIGVGGGKVLSVDSGGKVILVEDEIGDAEAILPSATTGMTLYYNGLAWAASDNLYHNGGQVGISTDDPQARLHVNTNLASSRGLIVQGYTSQTANLQEWRDVNGTVLAYVDANGVFNGEANVDGEINPGLTQGSVVFQGPSGLAGDSTNFFWDDTNKWMGIGTDTPASALHVVDNNNGATDALFARTTGTGYALGLRGAGSWMRFLRESDGTVLGQVLNGTINSVANNLLLYGSSGVGLGQNGVYSLWAVSNQVRLNQLGSAGTPSLSFTADQNTGVFSSGADTLNFSTAGTERVVIDSNGLVGIGTTSPAFPLVVDTTNSTVAYFDGRDATNFARLAIDAAGNADSQIVFQEANSARWTIGNDGSDSDKFKFQPTGGAFAGSEVMTLTSTGLVGIGNTNPGAALDVQSGTAGEQLEVRNPTGNVSYIAITDSSTGAGTSNGLTIGYNNGGLIMNRENTSLTFSTNDSPRMTITAGGNVGIGTSSTTFKLDVTGTGRFTNTLSLDTLGSGSDITLCLNASNVVSNCSSSLRYKEEVTELSLGLDAIMSMRPVAFTWKNGGAESLGFIAEEMAQISDRLVFRKDGQIEGIKYAQLTAVLAKAVQEQQLQIQSLGDLGSGNTDGPDFDETELNLRLAVLEESLEQSNAQMSQYLAREELSPFARWNHDVWNFVAQVIFEKPVQFLSTVVFADRVEFTDQDMGGEAVILAGATEVEVRFARPYRVVPVITATSSNPHLSVAVQQKTVDGFTLVIANPAQEDIVINWIALLVTNVQQVQSAPGASPDPSASPQPTSSATPSAIPLPQESPTPDASPSPTPTPTAEPTASPSL